MLLLALAAPARAETRLAEAPPTAGIDVSRYGPLMHFARSAERPASTQAAHAFMLRPIELRSVDDRRILVEGIIVHLRIDDPARFERAYAHDVNRMRSAAGRVQTGFEEELRRAVGRLTLAQLAKFDPLVLADAGTRLRRLLDQVGLTIDDLRGESMGYRTRVR